MLSDIMKKAIYIFSAALLLLSSCSKKGAELLRGSYSFKTGGSIELAGNLYETKLDTVRIDTTLRTIRILGIPITDTVLTYVTKEDTVSVRDTVVMRRVVTESGQMHVLKKDGDSLIVTLNITGGDPVVIPARSSGSSVTLGKIRRFVPVYGPSDVVFSYHNLELSGSGTRYDNMIVFDLEYTGDYSDRGFDGVVRSSRVKCIATENE